MGDHGKRAGACGRRRSGGLTVHHDSSAAIPVLPRGGCCPSAARAHFTTAAPKLRAHLSKVLPARGVVGGWSALSGPRVWEVARVHSAGTVEVAPCAPHAPRCTAVL